MKILHVVPSFAFGGMEKIICAIINETSKYYHHEILVIYNEWDAKKWLNSEDVTIHCLNRSESQLKFLQSLYKKIKEIHPETMMTYNWGATDAIWIGRVLRIKKIIHSEHGFNVDEAVTASFKRNILRNLLYRLSHDIVVVSSDLKKMIVEKFRINEKYVHFIANGIDSKAFSRTSYERENSRKDLQYGADNYVIGFSGRLDPVKNFEFMLDVFEACLNQDTHCRLLIIGEGQERENIERICDEKHIAPYVSLIGKKDNVVPYLGALDVFLLTSVTEQMPMTILEAMSLGLPVVASNVGDISRMIAHGSDGMVFDLSAAPAAVAGTLLTLRDTAVRQAMGTTARQKILAAFREERMVEQYRHVIDGDVCGRSYVRSGS